MDLTVLFLLLWRLHSFVFAVSFDRPPNAGETISIAENEKTEAEIYTLQATDTSGNTLTFSILSQSPSEPAFTLSESDSLLVPIQGLDAESVTEYNFTFSVTAGTSTADSQVLTVRVTDFNDNDPAFHNTSYTGEVWKNDPAGTSILTVRASDPDISNKTITYSIAGGQTTFSVNNSGVIILANISRIESLSSSIPLQVLASDGGRTGTVTLTVTLNDDPCSTTPCQNSGTCNSIKGNYNCTCLRGYKGRQCQSVDYCYQNPCQNGGTCSNLASRYKCICDNSYKGENCTQVISTAASSPSVNIHLIVAIVVGLLCFQYIDVERCVLTRQDNAAEQTRTDRCESSTTGEETCARSPGEGGVRRPYEHTKRTTAI